MTGDAYSRLGDKFSQAIEIISIILETTNRTGRVVDILHSPAFDFLRPVGNKTCASAI
jgi:hypothetical protein